MNLIFIMGVFFAGTIVANPFIPMAPTVPYRLLLALIQVALLTVECTVIGYTLSEFFRKDLGMPIRLWGAACIYLMIGLAFGSIYEILCVLNIRCLGADIPLRTVGLMKRYGYSLTVLSGMNSPFGNASDMIFSMGTVEALWGQIFIVLIVARLLTSKKARARFENHRTSFPSHVFQAGQQVRRLTFQETLLPPASPF